MRALDESLTGGAGINEPLLVMYSHYRHGAWGSGITAFSGIEGKEAAQVLADHGFHVIWTSETPSVLTTNAVWSDIKKIWPSSGHEYIQGALFIHVPGLQTGW